MVGGKSSDTSLVSSIMMPNPIVLYVKQGGLYLWSIYLNANMYDTVKHLAFNADQSKIVVALKPFGLVILNALNGYILSSYQESDPV